MFFCMCSLVSDRVKPADTKYSYVQRLFTYECTDLSIEIYYSERAVLGRLLNRVYKEPFNNI